MSDHLLPALQPLLSRVRRDVHVVRTKAGRVMRTDAALTDAKVLGHLSGQGSTVGAYHVLPGDSRTRVAVFDFDDHVKAEDGQGDSGTGVGWARVCAAAKPVWDSALARDWRGHVFRSGGGRGIHIFFIWDQPQDCYSVRETMREILAECGLSVGTGGLAGGQVEVFPKQNKVVEGAFGSQFWLPLGRKSVPLCTDDFLGWGEPLPREAALGLKWRASAAVPVRSMPVREFVEVGGRAVTVYSGAAVAKLAEQLRFIGFNNAGGDDYTYERWLQVAFGVHFATGGSEEGFELWRQWSSLGADFADEQVLRAKWDSIKNDRGGSDGGVSGGALVTARSLEFLARSGGWKEDIEGDFEVLDGSADGRRRDDVPQTGGDGSGGDVSEVGRIIFEDGSAWMAIGRRVYRTLFWWEDRGEGSAVKTGCLGGFGTLWFGGGEWWLWNGRCYASVPQDAVEGRVRLFLERCLKYQKNSKGEVNMRLEPVPFNPSLKSMAEIMRVLQTLCHKQGIEGDAYSAGKGGVWLDERCRDAYLGEGGEDAGGLRGQLSGLFICLEDGLLRVSDRTLLPHTPAYFGLNVVPLRWGDAGKGSGLWEKFLGECFDGDQESAACLQEIFGLMLVPDTSFQKMFLIIGRPRSGKGTIGRILAALLGKGNVASVSMDSLSDKNGLDSLLGKTAAIIPDSRNGTGSAFGQNVNVAIQRILSITGQDDVSVQRKYKQDWIGPIGARLLLMSNEIPSVGDETDAFVIRCIALKTGQSFLGKEDRNLSEKLMSELPHILFWALDGLERLYARGRFFQPVRGQCILDKMRDMNNPLQAYIKDWCVVDGIQDTPVDLFYDRYRAYVNQMGYRKPMPYGRFLDALVTMIGEGHRFKFQVGNSRGRTRIPLLIGVACREDVG